MLPKAILTLIQSWKEMLQSSFFKKLDYDCFVKASYDGSNAMTENTDFKIAEGSLIISLEDSLLNSLSIGVHTLNITFEDGSAVTTFKVVEKSSGSDSSSTDYNPPKTGIE